jgi:eukaryotic-like serine/threonine-protein kinase
MRMSRVIETIPQPATPPAGPAGGVLRCGGHRVTASGSQTQARIADEVAREAARRIGTIAILTSLTVVASAILRHALEPEMALAQQTLLYRLSALFLVLAGAGLAALQRAKLVSAQDLLDLGLVFEIAGAGALALMENSARLTNSAFHGTTIVAAWIAICVVVIPNRPWKSITAALLSAAMVPIAHLIAAQIMRYPAMPYRQLASYALGPIFVAGWTPFISVSLRHMHEDLSRTEYFGSYHLVELLGRGGMGEVWLARHRFLRREAALKVVLGGLLEKAGAWEQRQIQKRFETEAQAIASLRSPHTVEIYDYGLAENGSLYYAMEYLEGLDAETLVNEYGPQPPGRVVSFLRQACESLEEAHDAGLIHRDVKASNIFICRLGKQSDFVKVLDFGLVKELAGPTQTTLTKSNGTSGTPAFMAPEQVRGDQVDARTDIYGLGCLAYFLLTGNLVFNKPNGMAMAAAHLTERPELPSSRSELPVPASLENVVMACLEKKAADRPQSAAALRAMLDACADVAPWTAEEADRWWLLHRPEPVRKAS